MPQADPYAKYRRAAPVAAPTNASGADPYAAYRRPATPTAASEPVMTLNPSAGYYGGALEAATGFVKGAGRTAAKLGELVHTVPGFSSGIETFWDAIYSDDKSVVQDTPDLTANAFKAASDVTAPTNNLQRVGAGAEQVAEFLVPGAIGEKTAATIAAKAAPYFRNAPRLVQAAVKLAPRSVNEAAKSAAVAAAQGGDATTAAEFGAAGPVIGKAAGAGGRYLGKKAADLVASLNMLPASADDAIALAARANIPISAATATGNPYVKSIQHMSDRSLVGSVVAGRAVKAEADGLATLGEGLAARAHPTRVSAAEAGSGAQKGVGVVVRTQKRAADTAYGRFREIEADPANLTEIAPNAGAAPQPVPMATDLSEVKAAIAPIAERLAAKRAVTGVLLGKEGQAAATIEALLKGPDAVSASVADAVLSDLKSMARTNHPDLRTAGQGIAAKAVFNLEKAVGEAAERAGPEAVAARNAGRVATQAKYAAGKLLENLEGKAGDKSPVTVFRSMTGADDVGVGRLKAVLNKTPETKPLIARAVLDRLIDHPTATPGRSLTNWQKLGPETKAALYSPEHVKDLDAFFKLRKMMAENVNPSGSAHTAVNYAKGAFTYANPLAGVAWHITDGAVASLLHSRAGVRLLTRGMRIPSRNTAVSKAWAEDFTTMLARVGAGATAGSPAQRP